MAQCIVNYWGLEVVRTDFIALYCIVRNRNLQGPPKHLNRHPKVSEQNLLPLILVWRTKEASRPPRAHQDFPARTDPTKPHTTGGGRGIPTHQTPHHSQEGGNPFPPTRPHTTGGRRKGDSDPQHPTPQGEKEHHRKRRREGDSQSTSPQPTEQKEGCFPDHLGGGWGRAAERATIYIKTYTEKIYDCALCVLRPRPPPPAPPTPPMVTPCLPPSPPPPPPPPPQREGAGSGTSF